jgi:sortase A
MEDLSEERRLYYLALAKEYNDFMFNWQQGQPHESISYEEVGRQIGRTLGTLDVPALNIRNMPFYHGTSYQTLMRGLGHFEQSSIPIGGINTRGVITGHSGIHNQLLFTEIKRLQVGDVFFVNILGERLAYEIQSFNTVLPTDVDQVMIRPGYDMVTLLTCTPPGINTYRLLVNGFRIPYEEAIAREVIVRNWWSYQVVVIGSLIIGAIFFIICFFRYRYLKKMIAGDELRKVARGTKKLKNFLRGIKIIFTLLLIGAILILGAAAYGFFRMQEEVVIGTMTITGEIANENRQRIISANYDEGQIASVTAATYAEAMAMTWETVNDWAIGVILLPDVNIDLPILAGIANTNLVTGGSTYRINQQLGQCNYVLLAHSVYGNSTVLFQPLANSQIGDRIYATDFQNVYIYEVTFNEVVLDTRVEFLEELGVGDGDRDGETPIITLMRCEGGIGTVHRRMVQGELVSVEPLNYQTMEMFDIVKVEATPGQRIPILADDPVTEFERFTVDFAARIISDPVQVALPLFLWLLFPILFLSVLPSQPKVKKDESYKKIVFS